MPFSYEDFFSFYRSEFLPAYTIVFDWIDYETVDINAKVVEILTSVANSFNSGSNGDEKERHKHNADQDLRDLTVLCYYFYSISFKSYFIDPILAHPTTARYCISVGFDLFQTKADEFNELLEKVQETTLKGEDPLRSDTIAIYRKINSLSLIIKRYIRESELDRWKGRWKEEGLHEIQRPIITAIVDSFNRTNPKTFAQKHPVYFGIIMIVIGYVIKAAIDYFIEPEISLLVVDNVSNVTVNTSQHP
jgi:hypothetical protein